MYIYIQYIYINQYIPIGQPFFARIDFGEIAMIEAVHPSNDPKSPSKYRFFHGEIWLSENWVPKNSMVHSFPIFPLF